MTTVERDHVAFDADARDEQLDELQAVLGQY